MQLLPGAVHGADEQLVLAAGDAQRAQPGRPEAVGGLVGRKPRQLAQRADPQPPQRLDQALRLAFRQPQPPRERRNREIREESRHTNVCSYLSPTESTYERFLFRSAYEVSVATSSSSSWGRRSASPTTTSLPTRASAPAARTQSVLSRSAKASTVASCRLTPSGPAARTSTVSSRAEGGSAAKIAKT